MPMNVLYYYYEQCDMEYLKNSICTWLSVRMSCVFLRS